jgi:hypothetical protein
MSALPAPLQSALRAFAPPTSDADRIRQLEAECKRLASIASRWHAEVQSLLRLPFEVEVETRRAGFHGPAEYGYVTADEDDVRDAVDALIDRHIDELEADVKRRMKLRGG